MDFVAPTTLEDAFRALDAEDARCLAGGQSLVAMMNLGLVAPSRLVSLRKIQSLKGIERRDGALKIGAMCTHDEIAALGADHLLAQVARVIAYPAIRAWGTIGGSVAHADPAADYPVALLALSATLEVQSAKGARRIAAGEFFRGLFETALERGEIVTAIHVPAQKGKSAYEKLSLVAGDFAILSVAAAASRVAVGGYSPVPMLLEDARNTEPMGDQRASAGYRRKVLPRLVQRVVERCK
ncbi:MAG: FAD binding domain-containing protein [Betaproteobacteria bacterium]